MTPIPARSAPCVSAGLAAACLWASAASQPVDVPPTWGGDWDSRPRLTGNWDGIRDGLGSKGIVLDLDLLLTPQDVLSGGRSTGAELWGNAEYTLNVDSQKLGWWPGGFLKLEGNTGFGQNVLQSSGAIAPVNTAALIPASKATTALVNATFMQFFSEQLGVLIGKINTLDLGESEFYGDYHTQFLNEAFVSPLTLEQVPISTWGAGVLALPSKDLALSVLALNPNGTPTTNPLFGDGVELLAGAQLNVQPRGLVGHQSVSFSWNDKERYSLEQDPANIARLLLSSQFPRLANPGPELAAILERFFPNLLEPTVPANTANSSWALSYGFDQYLWQPAQDPHRGLGLFFAVGASDGDPNPIRYSFLLGLGGKGVVPGRGADTFGLGFARTQFSSALLPYLRDRLDIGLDHEDAFEAYYSAAFTGWLTMSADLQVVQPGLTKALAGSQLTDVDTTFIAGLRIYARF